MTDPSSQVFPDETPSEHASAEAVHAVKNAAQAVEITRQAQLAEVVEQTAQRTKESLLEGLKEVFGNSDSDNPQQMTILVRRIPILCTNIEAMHQDISDIKGNIKWAVRLVIGTVILGVLGLLFTTHGIQLP
jgi:HPt (histidine-containing phosphotransfer) domain-containing protein